MTYRRREAMRAARRAVILQAAMSVPAPGIFAVAADAVGTGRSWRGSATTACGGRPLPASPLTELLACVNLSTGSDEWMGVIPRDHSTRPHRPGMNKDA